MNESHLNAFNDAFDKNILAQEIAEAISKGESKEDISAAEISNYFNAVYKEFYEKVKDILGPSILSVNETEELLLANFNRELLLIKADLDIKMLAKAKEQDGIFLSSDYQQLTISGVYGEVAAADALENNLDGLNTIFSYLRYKDRVELDEAIDDDKALALFLSLYSFTAQMATYKACYDGIVWMNRWVSTEADSLLVKPLNKEVEEIIQIGKLRMDQTIAAAVARMQLSINNSKKERTYWEQSFRTGRKPRRVATILVKEGYVIPKLEKGFSNNHLSYDFSVHGQIISYYDFAEEVALHSTTKLLIKDMALMYAELAELIHSVEEQGYHSKGQLTIDAIYEAPFRITWNDLVQYLELKTYYSRKQIGEFIEILTHKEGRVNFWKTPFVKRGNDLLFPILPITGSHVLYIVDEWMKAGGFPLDNRGPLFEKHVKNQLKEDMIQKGYFCQISTSQKFCYQNKEEEVDLVAEFRECILVAEIKCIGYPLESRDKHNAYNRVSQGAKQLNRKVNFIERNKDFFSTVIPGLLSKPIIKTVIVNFPLFSGMSIEGVPISDAKFLHHYISVGSINKGIMSLNRDGTENKMNSKFIRYYTNESEFCKNLPHYLEHPVFVESTKEITNWETTQITSDISIEYVNIDMMNL
ncbi:MAG: hypothetical protein EOP45_02455 [Sphingobacteriaceae bacterium]|nr:MAG: hypothetical protein EOP45_02455 [Sphingobacteriaceae bacterium]